MTDFLTLLRRDHHDLEVGLDELVRAESIQQIRTTLDGVRLGLTAHAEAEDIVLFVTLERTGAHGVLAALIGRAHDAHVEQEKALAALVCAAPSSSTWRERADRLREMVHIHAAYEEQTVVPAIRELAPNEYDALAGQFATERLRQLSMLEPSSVIHIPDLARAS
jgi:hypothetical protein